MSENQKKEAGAGRSKKPTGALDGRRSKVQWVVVAAVAAAALVALGSLLGDKGTAVASPIEFTDVREQAKEFIGYYNSIQLTPEQQLVKRQALSRIPAPCCSDNSAYTCCCPCNMAKTWWGLTHHLIVNEGYDAEQVQAAVERWIDFINPQGFSGKACYTGGCPHPFNRDGCGGMSESEIVF